MIASQMGDTAYRGKIIWMLLTARPDQLPVDLKRQGRAEVHIPLFYPTDQAELQHDARWCSRRRRAPRSPRPTCRPTIPHQGNLSGADIEGIIGRAFRTSLLGGSRTITKDALAAALDGFMPSTQTLEREAQELAAIIECTDVEFLPPSKREKLEQVRRPREAAGAADRDQADPRRALERAKKETTMARTSWINDDIDPDLDAHVAQLEHFAQSLADGVVDAKRARDAGEATSSPR